MTPEAQRIAIAEACGWKIEMKNHPDGWNHYHAKHPLRQPEWGYASVVPDYLKDLNAMHEAEGMLTHDQLITYNGWLVALCESKASRRAEATQRAEAFLLTIGKWEESPAKPIL